MQNGIKLTHKTQKIANSYTPEKDCVPREQPFGRLKCRWEDIRMDLKKMGWTGCIRLRVGTTGRLL
jgi:hypothetical protein